MNEHLSPNDNNNNSIQEGDLINGTFLTRIIDIITNLSSSKCTIIEKQILLLDCIKQLLNTSFSGEMLKLLGPLLKEITFEQSTLLLPLISRYLSLLWCRWINEMKESSISIEVTGMFLSKLKKEGYQSVISCQWSLILSYICIHCKISSNFILEFTRFLDKFDSQFKIITRIQRDLFYPILTVDIVTKLKDLLTRPKLKYLSFIKYAVDMNSFSCFDRKIWRKFLILEHWPHSKQRSLSTFHSSFPSLMEKNSFLSILTRLMFVNLEIVHIIEDLNAYIKKSIYQDCLGQVISFLISFIWNDEDIEIIFLSWLSLITPSSSSSINAIGDTRNVITENVNIATSTLHTSSNVPLPSSSVPSSLSKKLTVKSTKWIPNSNFYFAIGSALATRLWPKISLLDRIPLEFHDGFFDGSLPLVSNLGRDLIELVIKYPKSSRIAKRAIKLDPLQAIKLIDFTFDLVKKHQTIEIIKIFSLLLKEATRDNCGELDHHEEIKSFISIKQRENLSKYWPLFSYAPQEDILFSHLEKQLIDKEMFFIGLKALSTIIFSSYMGIYIGFLRTAIQSSWSCIDGHIALLALRLSLQIQELTLNHSDEMNRFIIQLICDKILFYTITDTDMDTHSNTTSHNATLSNGIHNGKLENDCDNFNFNLNNSLCDEIDKNNSDMNANIAITNFIFEESIKWLKEHFYTIPINMQKISFSQLCLYHHSIDSITCTRVTKALLNSISNKNGIQNYNSEERSFILEASQQLVQIPLNSIDSFIQNEAVECLGLTSRFGQSKFKQEFLNRIISEALASGGMMGASSTSTPPPSRSSFIMAIGQCCMDDSVFPILSSLLKSHEEFRLAAIRSMADCLKRGIGISSSLKSQLEIPFLLMMNDEFDDDCKNDYLQSNKNRKVEIENRNEKILNNQGLIIMKFTRILLEVRGPEIIQNSEFVNMTNLLISLIIDTDSIKKGISNLSFNDIDTDSTLANRETDGHDENHQKDNGNHMNFPSYSSDNIVDGNLFYLEEKVKLTTLWMILLKRAILIPNLLSTSLKRNDEIEEIKAFKDSIREYLRWFVEFSLDPNSILNFLFGIMELYYDHSWKFIIQNLHKKTIGNGIWSLLLEKCLAYNHDDSINNLESIELLVELVWNPREYIRIVLNILKPFTEGINRTNHYKLMKFSPKIMNRFFDFLQWKSNENEKNFSNSIQSPSHSSLFPSHSPSFDFISIFSFDFDINEYEPQIITILNSGVNLLEEEEEIERGENLEKEKKKNNQKSPPPVTFLILATRLWILSQRPWNNWNISRNPRLLKLIEKSKEKLDKIEFLLEFSQDIDLVTNSPFLRIHDIKQRLKRELYKFGRLLMESKSCSLTSLTFDYNVAKKLCLVNLKLIKDVKEETKEQNKENEQIIKLILAFSIFKKNDFEILSNLLFPSKEEGNEEAKEIIKLDPDNQNDIIDFLESSSNLANIDIFRILMKIGSKRAIENLSPVIYNVLMLRNSEHCLEILEALIESPISLHQFTKDDSMDNEKEEKRKMITWSLIILLLEQSKIINNPAMILLMIKKLIPYMESKDQVGQLLAILPFNIAIQALTIIITKATIDQFEDYFIELLLLNNENIRKIETKAEIETRNNDTNDNDYKSLIQDCLYILRGKKPLSYQRIIDNLASFSSLSLS